MAQAELDPAPAKREGAVCNKPQPTWVPLLSACSVGSWASRMAMSGTPLEKFW